uniref:Uncharacterized protein n=1 Tax=Arundo donax TaxID=35708 RepID=A0A0A9A2X9_ARUDO
MGPTTVARDAADSGVGRKEF